MTHDTFARILAIELRHRTIGIAVLERERNLVHSGVRTFRTRRRLVEIIALFITSYVPYAIVLKRGDHRIRRHRRDVASSVRAIRRECTRGALPFHTLDVHEVRCAFQISSRGSKEAVARAVAVIFPELKWKLPPTRHKRSWVHEGWNMPAFDAVATGLAFLARGQGGNVHAGRR